MKLKSREDDGRRVVVDGDVGSAGGARAGSLDVEVKCGVIASAAGGRMIDSSLPMPDASAQVRVQVPDRYLFSSLILLPFSFIPLYVLHREDHVLQAEFLSALVHLNQVS